MESELDEESLIRLMVRVLREHPGEWLTFGRLSHLVAVTGCDADLLGAIADYRNDLFAMAGDRKVKLRSKVVEDVAEQGIAGWRIPSPPE